MMNAMTRQPYWNSLRPRKRQDRPRGKRHLISLFLTPGRTHTSTVADLANLDGHDSNPPEQDTTEKPKTPLLLWFCCFGDRCVLPSVLIMVVD